MPLKKQPLNDNEIPIYDEALIYQRGEYWQMRMWLTKERKYARFSLRTRNRDTAIDKAKKHYHELMAQQLSGKTYFSMTTKQAVEEYVKQRQKDMEAGLIVKGRLGTIKTHLEHWLKYVGKDTKIKEMERSDCENYFHNRELDDWKQAIYTLSDKLISNKLELLPKRLSKSLFFGEFLRVMLPNRLGKMLISSLKLLLGKNTQ
jgi:hypothetical protein